MDPNGTREIEDTSPSSERPEGGGEGSIVPFVGVVLYGSTSGLVTAAVLLDYVMNYSLYTPSYALGAPFFAILNLLVTVVFTWSTLKGRSRWSTMVAPVAPLVMIFWLYHGLSALGSTVLLATLGTVGLVLVWGPWYVTMRRNGGR